MNFGGLNTRRYRCRAPAPDSRISFRLPRYWCLFWWLESQSVPDPWVCRGLGASLESQKSSEVRVFACTAQCSLMDSHPSYPILYPIYIIISNKERCFRHLKTKTISHWLPAPGSHQLSRCCYVNLHHHWTVSRFGASSTSCCTVRFCS